MGEVVYIYVKDLLRMHKPLSVYACASYANSTFRVYFMDGFTDPWLSKSAALLRSKMVDPFAIAEEGGSGPNL